MAKYNTSNEIWKTLGSDTYTKVRTEAVGTISSSGIVNLAKENVISGSETIYTGGTAMAQGTGTYSINYDDGRLSMVITSGVITADYNYADMPDSQIQSLLNQADDELEMLTGRNFDLTTTSEYADVTNEQKVFWTKFYPVNSLSASCNVASEITDTPSWSTSTEGLGNDYLMDTNDKLIGKLEYIDNAPLDGQKRLKLEYSYGYSTIPDSVKELNALLVIRKMVNSTIYKAIFKGRDQFSPARLAEIEARIAQLTGMLRKQNISRI
jgi:hypothetical protein